MTFFVNILLAKYVVVNISGKYFTHNSLPHGIFKVEHRGSARFWDQVGAHAHARGPVRSGWLYLLVVSLVVINYLTVAGNRPKYTFKPQLGCDLQKTAPMWILWVLVSLLNRRHHTRWNTKANSKVGKIPRRVLLTSHVSAAQNLT